AREQVGVLSCGHRTDDHRLPAPGDVDEDVILGEQAVLVEGPARHLFSTVRGRAKLDRRRGRGAGGHAHEGRAVVALVEQVDGGEVEVELGNLRGGQVRGDRAGDRVPRRAGL